MGDSQELVTIFGGAGYIGSHLVRLLLEDGYRVRVFDNFLFGRSGVEGIDSDRLEVIEGDICNTKEVYAASRDADCVVLLAAIVGHRKSDIKWNTTRSVNFLAANVVLDAAVEHGASRFIFASTNSVYGDQAGVMYETAIPTPISLYARLKLRMEERVLKAKRSGFHPIVLRIATCHGYSPRMRFDLVLNNLVRDAVCRNELDIENGEQSRSLVHVQDAARAFKLCINAHANLISGEIFNVGSKDQNLRINELANMVRASVPEASMSFQESEPDLTEYRLSCSKIEKVLDFAPEWSIEKSIEEMRDHLRSSDLGDAYSLRYHNT